MIQCTWISGLGGNSTISYILYVGILWSTYLLLISLHSLGQAIQYIGELGCQTEKIRPQKSRVGYCIGFETSYR